VRRHSYDTWRVRAPGILRRAHRTNNIATILTPTRCLGEFARTHFPRRRRIRSEFKEQRPLLN
jgi:hypothetical protein